MGFRIGIITKVMKLLVVAAMLLGTVAQSAQPVDEAFERLAKVEIFAFGPVG